MPFNRPPFFFIRRAHAGLACVFMTLLGGTAVAGADPCRFNPSGDSAQRITVFDKKVLALSDRAGLRDIVNRQVCGRDNIYAFLTSKPGYDYVGCFAPSGVAASFWSGDHDSGERHIRELMQQCVTWAERRYVPALTHIAAAAKQQAAAQQQAEAQRKAAEQAAQREAEARAQAEASQRAEALARRKAAEFAAALSGAGATKTESRLWAPDTAAAVPAQRLPAELAAFLLAGNLARNAAAPNGGGDPTLATVYGAPRIDAVERAGDGYRLRLNSTRVDYGMDVRIGKLAAGVDPKSLRPWVVFATYPDRVEPKAVVLEGGETPVQGEIVGAAAIPLPAIAEPPKIPRASGTEPRYRLRLRCEPPGGGDTRPLRRCLKPDGTITAIDGAGAPQYMSYAQTDAAAREVVLELGAGFDLLVRTGSAEQLHALNVEILDAAPSASGATTLYAGRVTGGGASVFLRQH